MDMFGVIKAPMKDKNWIKTCGIMGLCMFIPVVGPLALLGWMVSCFESRRDGNETLPPAGLSYIGKGFSLFLGFLPMFLVSFALMFVVVWGMMSSFAHAPSQAGDLNDVQGPMVLMGLTFAVGGGLSLFFSLVMPAILYVHMVEGRSFASARLGSIFGLIGRDLHAYVMLWVTIFLALCIAQVGVLAFGVGLLVTVPLSYAIMAYAVADYSS
jgi:hypothetical protein